MENELARHAQHASRGLGRAGVNSGELAQPARPTRQTPYLSTHQMKRMYGIGIGGVFYQKWGGVLSKIHVFFYVSQRI